MLWNSCSLYICLPRWLGFSSVLSRPSFPLCVHVHDIKLYEQGFSGEKGNLGDGFGVTPALAFPLCLGPLVSSAAFFSPRATNTCPDIFQWLTTSCTCAGVEHAWLSALHFKERRQAPSFGGQAQMAITAMGSFSCWTSARNKSSTWSFAFIFRPRFHTVSGDVPVHWIECLSSTLVIEKAAWDIMLQA